MSSGLLNIAGADRDGQRRMRLSKKGDYGVRALIDLALHDGEGPVRRAGIADRQRIPESYLDHLLAQLRRGGFVRSVRGPGGGHVLTRRPGEICLLHVIESLEGSVAPIACVETGENCAFDCGLCAQRPVWEGVYDDMRRRLGAVTIADLAERAREQQRAAAANYSI